MNNITKLLIITTCLLKFSITQNQSEYPPSLDQEDYQVMSDEDIIEPTSQDTGIVSKKMHNVRKSGRKFRLKHKKKRNNINNTDIYQPEIRCPHIFAYNYDAEKRQWFGYIALNKEPGLTAYELDVNMTIAKNIRKEKGIKLYLLSTKNQVMTSDIIRWKVKFPVQDMLPKLVMVKFNGQVLCTNIPDPESEGKLSISMMANSRVTTKNPTVVKVPNLAQFPGHSSYAGPYPGHTGYQFPSPGFLGDIAPYPGYFVANPDGVPEVVPPGGDLKSMRKIAKSRMIEDNSNIQAKNPTENSSSQEDIQSKEESNTPHVEMTTVVDYRPYREVVTTEATPKLRSKDNVQKKNAGTS